MCVGDEGIDSLAESSPSVSSDSTSHTNRDRTYSIVFAVELGIAQACALYDPDSQMFLGWKDLYHFGLDPTRMPSIVYRELLPTDGDHSLLTWTGLDCSSRLLWLGVGNAAGRRCPV